MKALSLALAAALVALPVQAGENAYLGQIVVSANSKTNATTAAPFVIPPGAKITIYCTAAVNILVDNAAATTTTGLPVAATTLFPTSVGRSGSILLSGAVTAQVAIFGTATCSIWQRDGNE
jgi:hypothetical protein